MLTPLVFLDIILGVRTSFLAFPRGLTGANRDVICAYQRLTELHGLPSVWLFFVVLLLFLLYYKLPVEIQLHFKRRAGSCGRSPQGHARLCSFIRRVWVRDSLLIAPVIEACPRFSRPKPLESCAIIDVLIVPDAPIARI